MSQLFWCAVCLFIGLLFPSLIYQIHIQDVVGKDMKNGLACKFLLAVFYTDIFGVITIIALGNGFKLL